MSLSSVRLSFFFVGFRLVRLPAQKKRQRGVKLNEIVLKHVRNQAYLRLLEDRRARATSHAPPARRKRPLRVGRRDGERLAVGETEGPFGQLPLLDHDGVRVAQSGAIARYCAKMAKLWPANDWKAEVLCDMVMEQCNDIFGLFAKAKYAGDEAAQADAWDKVRNEKMPKHLDDLEALLTSRAGPFFGGPLPNAADVAVFSTVLLAEKAGVFKSTENFPGLQGICEAVRGMGTVEDYVAANVPPYFKAL